MQTSELRKQILSKIANKQKIGGFYRRDPKCTEIGLEVRAIDPIAVALRNPRTNDQQRTFCYSKVVNSTRLAELVQFKTEPWLNCIAYKNSVVAYVWDTRQIVAIEQNSKAVDTINKMAWTDTVYDVYNAWQKHPMLVNDNKIPGGDEICKVAKRWVQPTIKIDHYQTRNVKGVFRHEEYEILTYMPNEGEIYIGEYVVEEISNKKYRSVLEMNKSLLKDVWPAVSSKTESKTCITVNRLLTFSDIQFALLDGLTIR